jgi:hypothetical protein
VGRLVRRDDPTSESNGTTHIHGPVMDQAALHGLLEKLRDVRLPLISVTRIERDPPDLRAPLITARSTHPTNDSRTEPTPDQHCPGTPGQ